MSATPGRANVVGTGLIGGSIGLALRARGWTVSGTDRDPARTERAAALGALDAVGVDARADVTFVATPVGAVAAAALAALGSTTGAVTDVGSVKAPIVAAVDDTRFVGGHPMAGSEQEGVDGAAADLFEGAVWVLTPAAATDDDALHAVRSVVASLGAEVVVIPPDQHDALVATVSHVPHLTAAALMALADERADQHAALLRLAAGGFRDMTRIAAGHPGIWPDICGENRAAIVETLDGLIASLRTLRDVVDNDDRGALVGVLERARHARLNLPSTAGRPDTLAEVRVPIPDRPGALAAILTRAADLGVNVYDLEMAHSAEGPRGVAIALVDRSDADRYRDALRSGGYPASAHPLE